MLLGAAAAVTERITLGTFVLADPFRDARVLDWQAQTLHQQTGGRFELGLGAGRPGADAHAAVLGREFGSPGERVTRMAETIALLKRSIDRPRLLLAASGPKMLALAAQEADIVTFSWAPTTTEDQAQSIVDRFRTLAGPRLPEIELGLNLIAVGDEPSQQVVRFAGVDLPELAAMGAVTVLPSDPGRATENLAGGGTGGGFPTSRSTPATWHPSPRSRTTSGLPGRSQVGEWSSDLAEAGLRSNFRFRECFGAM